MTSSKGTYSISGVGSGSYTVSAWDNASMNAPVSAKVTVTKGKNLKKNLRACQDRARASCSRSTGMPSRTG